MSRAKKAKPKTKNTKAKSTTKSRAAKETDRKPKKRPKKRKFEHHPDHYNTSESYLIQDLDEDLKDAWQKIRALGESLGEQRIYASGRAIMFSRKVCYFFVRPKKSYLEVVIFLKEKTFEDLFKSIAPVSKTKFAHTFRLIHSDQVEGELADAVARAYAETPAN